MRRWLSLLIGETFALSWCWVVGEEGKTPCNIFSVCFSQTLRQSLILITQMHGFRVQERVCHLILGDSEQ